MWCFKWYQYQSIKTANSFKNVRVYKWLKQHTRDKFFRFSRLENGYCYDEPWDFNGARYTFKAAEKCRENRRDQLDKKRKWTKGDN